MNSKPPKGSGGSTQTLGRFSLLTRLSCSAGVEWHEAYDRDLDRKVCIVLVSEAADQRLQDQVVRDARALAQIDHPNVVEIHDVGTDEGRLFIAMNASHGESLAEWGARTRSQNPAWFRTALAVVLQAGRGVSAVLSSGASAIHAAPVSIYVSGDAKTPKILVGGFLRRSVDGLDPASEVVRRRTIDPTESFYRTAWELLYETPYPTVPEPRAHSPLSLAARRVLERPLAGHRSEGPEARDLVEVLDELESMLSAPPPRNSRRVLRLALIVLSATIAGGAYWVGSSPDDCTGAEEEFAAVWSAELREEVREAIIGTNLPHAEDTWSRVERDVDAYGNRWKAAWTDACLSATTSEEQRAEEQNVHRACLGEVNSAFRSAVEPLLTGSPVALAHNAELIRSVPDPGECLVRTERASSEEQDLLRDVTRTAVARTMGHTREALRASELRVETLPPDATPFVRALVLLEHGRAVAASSNPRHALDPLAEAYAIAHASNDAPIAVRSALELLALHVLLRSSTKSTRRWLEVVRASSRSLSAEQSAQLRVLEAGFARQHGDTAGLRAAAQRFKELTETGHENGYSAEQRRILADELCRGGEVEQAVEAARHALEVQAASAGAQHPSLAAFERTLGQCLLQAKNTKEARVLLETALRRVQSVQGPQGPESATFLAALAEAECNADGGSLAGLGRAREAERLLAPEIHTVERKFVLAVLRKCGRSVQPDRTIEVSAQLIETAEEVYGSDHQLSVLARARHVADLSHATFRNPERIWRQILFASAANSDKAPGWNFNDAVEIHRLLGGAARVLGEGTFALQQAEAAAELLRRESDPSPWATTAVHVGLCRARRHVGDYDGALPACLAALESARDDEPLFVAEVEHTVGKLLRLLGRYDEALEHGRTAIRILTEIGRTGPHSLWLADAHSSVATSYEHLHDHENAEHHYRSSFELLRNASDAGRIHSGSGLARMLGKLGRQTEAWELLAELEELGKSTDPYEQASIAEARGYLQYLDDPAKGSALYREALDFLRTTGSPSELLQLCGRVPMQLLECESIVPAEAPKK